MELVTRKSECKRLPDAAMLIKKPKDAKKIAKPSAPKYCIIIKPFHSSFLPYKQIVFRGVTFSDDFSIELIRNNEPSIAHDNIFIKPDEAAHLFHTSGSSGFKLMS